MNRKNVFFDVIFVFCLTIIILLSSFLTSYFISNNEAKLTLKTYGDEIALIYKSSDDDLTIENEFGNIINIRITILKLSDGTPLLDINPLDNTLSNEDRYNELKNNLNSFYTKKSLTTKYETLYYVTSNSNYFIRVGLPVSQIQNASIYILEFGILGLVVINLAYGSLRLYFYKKSINKLKSSINELNNVVSLPKFNDGDDGVEILNNTLKKINVEFQNKINELQLQKNQNELVLDSIDEGFIVINKNKSTILINKYALEALRLDKDDVLNQNYLYLSFENKINELIENQNFNHITSFDYKINGKIYLFFINKIDENYLSTDQNSFVAITFIDVTQKRLSDKIKREFIQNAGHELKTPLTTIIGYEGMIENNILSEKDEVAEANQIILKEAKRMKSVIDDMLTLAELESKETEKGNVEDINAAKEIESIIDSFKYLAMEKNISISTNLKEVTLHMDSMDFDRLCRNLISNGIKYNKQGGELKITLNTSNLIVEDTGLGIAEKDINRIFERFYMVDKSHSRQLGGTGLGLAIVKHILIKYNFTIKVESQLGIGSKFIVSFNK